jgi:metal-responsive CopG/Arc/MetJ family transcriptional regulator
MVQQALSPAGGESPKIHLRLAAEDAQQLDRVAAQRGLSRSVFVRDLIRQALAAEQDTGPPGR